MDGDSSAKESDGMKRPASIRRMMGTASFEDYGRRKKTVDHILLFVLILLSTTAVLSVVPGSTTTVMQSSAATGPPTKSNPSTTVTSGPSTVPTFTTGPQNSTTNSARLSSVSQSTATVVQDSTTKSPPTQTTQYTFTTHFPVSTSASTTTGSPLPSGTPPRETFTTRVENSSTISAMLSSLPHLGSPTLSLPPPSMSSMSPSPVTEPTSVQCNFSQNCSDQAVYYWMIIKVEFSGGLYNESDITTWLQSLFQSHLGECNANSSLNPTSSSPSPLPFTFTKVPSKISNGSDTSSTANTTNSSTSAASTNNIVTVTTPQFPNHSTMKANETSTTAFQGIDVSCDNKTAIRQTTCTVLLQLSQPTNPCCIAHIINMHTDSYIQAQVVGDQVEKVVKGLCQSSNMVPLDEGFDKCNSSLDYDLCSPNVTVNVSCSGKSKIVYAPDSGQNQTNCSAVTETPLQFCYCSTYCNSTAAYYYLEIKIIDSHLDVPQVRSQISQLRNPICNITDPKCQVLKNISEIYENSTVLCGSTGNCSVFVKLKQSTDVCSVREALISVLNSNVNQNAIQTNGDVIRAAICRWDNEPTPDLAQANFINLPLSPSNFCLVADMETFLNYCNDRNQILVLLKDHCLIDPATVSPITLQSPITTEVTNVTTITITPTNTFTTLSPPDNTTQLQTTTTTLSSTVTVTTTNSATTLNTSSPMVPTNSKPSDTATTATTMYTTASTNSSASAEKAAEDLLNTSKNASTLTLAQVEKLVHDLEFLLSGPSVSLALGKTSINIVSNLQDAPVTSLASTSNRVIGIVDKVGLKLVVQGQSETILSPSVALAVKSIDGANFQQTTFIMTDSSNLQIGGGSRLRRSVEPRLASPQGSIVLPSSLTQNLSTQQQQQASRVQFNFYQKSILFQDRSLNPNDSRLISGVLASSVANLSISNLRDNVVITLKKTEPVTDNISVLCVFWDFGLNDGFGGWSDSGCTVLDSTENETVCGCNHLTSFGVLLDISREGIVSRLQATILTYITYIGCGISAIFLSITLLTYLSFEKLRKDIPSKILIQLCLALLMLNLVFLLDAWLALYPDAVGLCISTAFFLHYFLLASFTWMALEAVHMYIALVKVFNTYVSRFMIKIGFAGWGIPLLVVIIVIAIDKNNYGLVAYGKYEDGSTDDFCWLKNNIAFYVAVVAYFCVVFLLNLSMFIVVMVQLCRIKRQNPHNLQHRSGLQDLRSVAGLTVLLGLTWGFAFFAWGPVNLAFMYLFAIFNSLQGFFIFVFHCAVKENVRRQWRTYLCCGKFRLAENSDWSHTATQKTKKSSVNRVGSSFQSVKSSNSNNSSSSSAFLFSNSSGSDGLQGISSPFDDGAITAQEESGSDVVLNEINHRYRSQRSH